MVLQVIGREREVARVIQILGRRTKNNPILLGEPGAACHPVSSPAAGLLPAQMHAMPACVELLSRKGFIADSADAWCRGGAV
jgi:hypothetical protein